MRLSSLTYATLIITTGASVISNAISAYNNFNAVINGTATPAQLALAISATAAIPTKCAEALSLLHLVRAIRQTDQTAQAAQGEAANPQVNQVTPAEVAPQQNNVTCTKAAYYFSSSLGNLANAAASITGFFYANDSIAGIMNAANGTVGVGVEIYSACATSKSTKNRKQDERQTTTNTIPNTATSETDPLLVVPTMSINDSDPQYGTTTARATKH